MDPLASFQGCSHLQILNTWRLQNREAWEI